MEFTKKTLASIEKCYAVAGMNVDGEAVLVYAGEGNGSIHIFRGKDFCEHQILTTGRGGTMSIVPIEEKPGWFFVSRGFYSMIKSASSVVELVRYRNGKFEQPATLAAIPYLHRFGLVHDGNGKAYLVAATILSEQDENAQKPDWSKPGHVYRAVLPDDLENDFSLSFLAFKGDYLVNHGFCTGAFDGREAAFTTSHEGVFVWIPPDNVGSEWTRTQLLDIPVSDVAVRDIDGDGEVELAILAPFHGNQCKVFKNVGTGYEEIFSSPEENDFYHTIYSARLCGEGVFIGGARKGVMDLFVLRYDKTAEIFALEQIEAGVGPSNTSVLNLPEQDLVLSANRMIAEAACYSIVR
jgi:hypothetical protein